PLREHVPGRAPRQIPLKRRAEASPGIALGPRISSAAFDRLGEDRERDRSGIVAQRQDYRHLPDAGSGKDGDAEQCRVNALRHAASTRRVAGSASWSTRLTRTTASTLESARALTPLPLRFSPTNKRSPSACTLPGVTSALIGDTCSIDLITSLM